MTVRQHFRFSWLAAAGLSLFGTTALAQTDACTGNGKITRQIAKPMAAAQQAMRAGHWEESLEQISKAELTPFEKSAFDLYTMNEYRGYLYTQIGRVAEGAREMETAFYSPCMPSLKAAGRAQLLAGLYAKLLNHSKAAEFAELALEQERDPETLFTAAQENFRAGNHQRAVDLGKELVASEEKPREMHLLLLQAACRAVADSTCQAKAFEKLVTLYPKPEYLKAFTKVRNEISSSAEDGFKPLFNGKNLDGWTPKIAKHPAGDNYANTFRVEDGVIKVSYDKYKKFDRQFGHLFTNQAYSNYILRLDYKIVGKAIEDSPPWAKLNSGVMIHSQSPLSMGLDQEFPASMEFQFLATGASAGKQTGNVCTPGTNVEINGKLVTDHIIDSTSKFYPLDEWVSVEVEVHGNQEVIHRVNGVEVLRYQHPQLDPKDETSRALFLAGAPLQLEFGHIALQAESQPVWFRNIRIKPLE